MGQRRAMGHSATEWTRGARELTGRRFAEFQIALTAYNSRRLEPGLADEAAAGDLDLENAIARAEIDFIEEQRAIVAPLVADIPSNADDFIGWFERLRETGPGQGDP